MDEGARTEQNKAPVLTGYDLVIMARKFKDRDGNLIELIGLRDHGRCGRWHRGGEICRDCMLNCEHYLKINGKHIDRTFTQLEVLLMQESDPDKTKELKRLKTLQLKI